MSANKESYPFQIGLKRIAAGVNSLRGQARVSGRLDVRLGIEHKTSTKESLPLELNQTKSDISINAGFEVQAGFEESQNINESQTRITMCTLSPEEIKRLTPPEEAAMEQEYSVRYGLSARSEKGADWSMTEEEEAMLKKYNLLID